MDKLAQPTTKLDCENGTVTCTKPTLTARDAFNGNACARLHALCHLSRHLVNARLIDCRGAVYAKCVGTMCEDLPVVGTNAPYEGLT